MLYRGKQPPRPTDQRITLATGRARDRSPGEADARPGHGRWVTNRVARACVTAVLMTVTLVGCQSTELSTAAAHCPPADRDGVESILRSLPLGSQSVPLCVLAGGNAGPGEFHEPIGVATDPQGNVYVADRHNF